MAIFLLKFEINLSFYYFCLTLCGRSQRVNYGANNVGSLLQIERATKCNLPIYREGSEDNKSDRKGLIVLNKLDLKVIIN